MSAIQPAVESEIPRDVPTAMAVPMPTATAVPVVAATTTPGKQSAEELLSSEGMVVKQNFKDFLRCCLCQPNWQWTVHGYSPTYSEDDKFPTVMFVQEEATQCMRSFSWYAPGCRKTTYSVYEGESASGTKLMSHTKEQTCGQSAIVMITDRGPIYCPMCCCLPYFDTLDASGSKVGRTQYICDQFLFVPKFMVQDAQGKDLYLVRPETCIGGCCVEPKCDAPGGACCRIPFLIRDPATKAQIEDAHVSWLWPGLKKACCQRNNYNVKFPTAATADARKTMMGTVLLMDLTLWEVNQN